MSKRRNHRTAVASVSLAAVAASIFATATPALASGQPGDPYIPPQTDLAQSGVRTDGDLTPTIQDPNNGQAVSPPMQVTVSTDTLSSATKDGPMVQTAHSTQVLSPGQDATPVMSVDSNTALQSGASFAALNINTHWTGCTSTESSVLAEDDLILYTITYYKYTVHADWCGDGNGGVSKPNHYAYLSDVQHLWFTPGPWHVDNATYYNAWSGIGNYPKSGYNIFMQQEMDNVFPNGFSGASYPWVRLIIFADGVAWTDADVG